MCHHHVDRIPSVECQIREPFVHVLLVCWVRHPTADQNVLFIKIVRIIWLVSVQSVAILVSVLVGLMPSATLITISRFAPACLDMKAIPSLDVALYKVRLLII